MARKKGPQVQQAYEYIKTKIQNFEIPPGGSVSDHALEQDLNMSRSPIREAILRLAAEGLVEFTGKGAQVTNITLQDIIEICQVRRAVETISVEILMERGGLSQEQRETLTECFEHLQAAKEPARNYYYDDQFHDLIVNMSGNHRLVEISHQMRAQIYRARWLNCILPERMREANEEHRAIYQALMDNDRKATVRSIEAHLDQSEKNFRKILSSTNHAFQLPPVIPNGAAPSQQEIDCIKNSI